MKIEKINENQIRFFLSEADLSKRDIKVSELSYGSEKTQNLFREMMEEAFKEHGFYVNNTPLIIEAVPVALDSIMIIVTKVNSEDNESKLDIITKNRDHRKFKRKPVSNVNTGTDSKNDILIYSFDSLDNAALVCTRLEDCYDKPSCLYKLDKKYFLIIENDAQNVNSDFGSIETILNEYGEKHVSTILSKYYLIEHGEILIPEQAIDMLAKHLA